MKFIKPEEESALLDAMRRAYFQSSFWRKKFSALGIKESDFLPGFPFGELPMLSKAELLNDQAEKPPFGSLLSVPGDQLRRIHKTSGTTSTPFFIALTERDIQDTYMASKRAFLAAGMGPGDRVIHCLNFNMWSGGVSDYIPIEEVGATGVPFGVGNTALMLHVLKELQINAISSTPSYMFVLAERCRNDLGIDPKDLGLKRGYFGGEGLLQVDGVREEIEQTFGLKAFDANYGMSEVLSMIAGETQERNGLEYHAHGVLYAELTNPNGEPCSIEAGARGELVFSSLRREAQPLFRYRTNDLVEILAAEPGEDGLLRMRFKVTGRSDEMLVQKGVNFFPQALHSALSKFPDRIGKNYRVVRPENAQADAITCVFETSIAQGKDRDALEREVLHEIAAMLQIRVNILWVNEGEIPVTDNKMRFLINSIGDIGLS